MTWAQLQNTAPSSIAITKSRKKKLLLHTENWWMHANQPQYLIETKWILFHSNVELENRTATHAIDGSDEKNKNEEKNDIELNLCHLFIDSEYTHGPVISPYISIKGVITLDRDFFLLFLNLWLVFSPLCLISLHSLFCSFQYGSFPNCDSKSNLIAEIMFIGLESNEWVPFKFWHVYVYGCFCCCCCSCRRFDAKFKYNVHKIGLCRRFYHFKFKCSRLKSLASKCLLHVQNARQCTCVIWMV